MEDKKSAALLPPFSPALLAGIAMRPLPAKCLSRMLAVFLSRMEGQYPAISNRLVPLGHCRFHIIPTDLPFSFLLKLDVGKATAEILDYGQAAPNVTASISGDIQSFIQLLEGNVDGDALFFARRLVVEGDTEAVLTLRNAVDSVDLSIKHILTGMVGPLTPLFKRAATPLSSLHQTAAKDFEMLERSLIGPVIQRISQMEEEVDSQENILIRQGKEIRKMQAAIKRLGVVVGSD